MSHGRKKIHLGAVTGLSEREGGGSCLITLRVACVRCCRDSLSSILSLLLVFFPTPFLCFGLFSNLVPIPRACRRYSRNGSGHRICWQHTYDRNSHRLNDGFRACSVVSFKCLPILSRCIQHFCGILSPARRRRPEDQVSTFRMGCHIPILLTWYLSDRLFASLLGDIPGRY